MKKIVLITAVLGLLISGFTTNVQACSVIAGWPGTTQENMGRKDLVFTGTVKSIIQDKSAYGEYRITFAVDSTYKGTVLSTVTVRSQSSSAACGYDDGYNTFTIGSSWSIFASGNVAHGYTTDGISANTKYNSIAEANASFANLGIKPIQSEEPTMCTMIYAPVCGKSPSGEIKTYGNSCMLDADKATYQYSGECQNTSNPTPYYGILKVGSRGEGVSKLQATLHTKGFAVGSIDGIFGKITRSAVMAFQSAIGLVVDGIAGPKTQEKAFNTQ